MGGCFVFIIASAGIFRKKNAARRKNISSCPCPSANRRPTPRPPIRQRAGTGSPPVAAKGCGPFGRCFSRPRVPPPAPPGVADAVRADFFARNGAPAPALPKNVAAPAFAEAARTAKAVKAAQAARGPSAAFLLFCTGFSLSLYAGCGLTSPLSPATIMLDDISHHILSYHVINNKGGRATWAIPAAP